MTVKLSKLVIFVGLMFAAGYTQAQNKLDQAWKSFTQNDLKASIKGFSTSDLNRQEKADAGLGLLFIDQLNNTEDQSFEHFMQYFNNADNPYPALFALWNSPLRLDAGMLDSKKLSFLLSLLENPKANGTIKANTLQALANHYKSVNDFKNMKKYHEAVLDVETWGIVGEFENISASGFDKDFGVLAHPESSHEFINKRQAKVQWFDHGETRSDCWLDFDFHFYIGNSIIYAQSFCTSPIEQEVQLRLGTSGSYKVWLNDALIMAESEERNNDLDTYNATAKLAKGNNRILVQIGNSDLGRSNFMLRITNSNGDPIEGLTYSSTSSAYSKALPHVSKKIPPFAEDEYEKAVANDPSFVNKIMLVQTYLKNQKTFLARKVLKELEAQCGNSIYFLYQKYTALRQDDNSSGISTVIRKIRETDSTSYISLNLQFEEDYKNQKYDEAKEVLKLLESKYGLDESIYDKKIKLASSEKEMEKLIATIEEAGKKYPLNISFIGLNYLVLKDVKKNTTAAFMLLRKYNDKYFNTDIKTKMINHYLSNSNLYAALVMMKDLNKKLPYATGYWYDTGETYYNNGDYAEAIKLYNKCLDLAPYTGVYSKAIAKCYKEMGEKDKAKEKYEQAIAYIPTDYESREELRKLNGKEDVFNTFEKVDYLKAFEQSPQAKDYPNDHSIVLIDNEQNVVYKGGASQKKFYIMAKMLNSAGVDYWKDYGLGIGNNQRYLIEDAYIIKANKSKVDAETQGEQIVFRGLEVGDAICLTYQTQNYRFGKLAENYWDQFYFSRFLPVVDAKYSLLIDESIKFKHLVTNGSSLQPTIETKDEFKYYTWAKKDTKAIVAEPGMSSLGDVGQVLHISTFPDWNYIADWYTDLAITKTKTDYEVKEVVNELFADKKDLTELQKANIIYSYIVKNIRYSSLPFRQSGLIPQKPADVLNTKIGDCKDVSSLFCAMASEVGLNANLVLVNTRDYGDNSMPLPSIDFNHCIAKLNTAKGPYYIELTTDLLPMASYTNSLKGTNILDIEPNKTGNIKKLINPNRVPNIIHRKAEMEIKGNNIMVDKQNVKTGYYAATMRESYRDQGEDNQWKVMKEAILGEYPNIKLEKLSFNPNLNTTSDSVSYTFGYSAADALSNVAGMYVFKVPFSDAQETFDFMRDETRDFPLCIWQYFNFDSQYEQIKIKLPSDKKLLEVPASLSYNTKFGEYALSFKLDGTTLIVERKFKITADLVQPADFPECKQFLDKVIKGDATQLALK